jgi:hypothetical protein
LGAPHTPKYNRKHIALYNNIIKPQMIFTMTMYNTVTTDREQQQQGKYLMFLQNLN